MQETNKNPEELGLPVLHSDTEKKALSLITELFDTYVWEMEIPSLQTNLPSKLSEKLGLEPEKSLSYKTFLSHILAEDLHKWNKLLSEAQNKILTSIEEIRLVGKDSSLLYFRFVIRETDTPDKFLFLLQDITKHKSFQESLHQTSQRLKLATRAAKIGIWDLDIVRNILVWDEGMYRLYGITEKEFSGAYEAWEKGLHPDDKARAADDFSNAVKGNREFNTEFRVVWPDGTVRYIKAIAAVLRNSEGTPTQMIGTNWDITSIRLTEEERRKDQETISKMNEVAKIGNWEIDLRTDRIVWAKKTKEIHEVEEDYSPTMDDFVLFVKEGEQRSRIAKAISDAIQLGIGYDTDLQLVTKSGKTKWVRTLGQAEIEDGKCIRLYGIFQDIDERRRIEDDLLLSELTFRGAFENNGCGMALVSTEGKWLKVNRKLCEMLGYPEEEFLTTTFQDITHPDDLETDLHHVGKMLRGEISDYKMEKRYFRKNRSVIWISLSVSIVKDKQGKPLYFVSQIEDITQRKAAEKSILEVHLEMKQILDSATRVSIIRADAKGLITHFSRGAENLLGYSSEEIVGKFTPEYFHVPEEIEKRAEELTYKLKKQIQGFDSLVEIARREQFESRIWRYRRKDGSVFPVQLVVTAIRDQNSEITGFLGIGSNISETVDYQQRLEETKKQLEILATQLGQRNAQLLNYAHITSHNLRAPTTNLISLVELIQEADTQEEVQSLIGKFKITVNYLQETLDSLVEVLRIQEFAKRKIEKIRFELILNKITKILEGQILESQAKILSDFSSLAEWEYNPSYMESIFLNLISNSIKYRSPKRTPEIHIFTKTVQNQKYLIVQDNGLGIDLNKYGNKLFGLHKTFHRHPEARGVGLFLTKTQIESLDGKISAESELDRGTKIIIEFNTGRENS